MQIIIDAIAIFHPKTYGYTELKQMTNDKLFELFKQVVVHHTGCTISTCKFKSYRTHFGYVIECVIKYNKAVLRIQKQIAQEELCYSSIIKNEMKYDMYLKIGKLCGGDLVG